MKKLTPPSVLQLCCFNNFWDYRFDVESWDLRLKRDIFDIPKDYPKQFDIVCAAPPCDQFTKANSHGWEIYPERYIKIAALTFELCKLTQHFWFLENPPGRIEQFIPELTNYRILTWRSPGSNKEYVIYGNFLITQPYSIRYGRKPLKSFNDMSKKQRETWDCALIPNIINSLSVIYAR